MVLKYHTHVHVEVGNYQWGWCEDPLPGYLGLSIHRLGMFGLKGLGFQVFVV